MRVASALCLAATVGAQSPASGVKKVIELLTQLKAKVTEETAQGAKDAEEYADQCIATITGLEADVKYGGEKSEELAAIQENNAAKADQYAVEVASLGPQIGKVQSELKAATQVRNDEHKTFLGEESELTQAANMLTQAYAVLKRSLAGPAAFLQKDGTAVHSEADTRVTKIVNALSAVIAAAGAIDINATNKIRAFLEAEDSLSLGQPQAVVRSYESRSGGILDAIEELQEKAAQNLSALKTKEMDAKHAFEMLAQDLRNQIQAKEDALSNAKMYKEEAGAAAGAAGAQLQTVNDSLQADKTALANSKVSCQKHAEEWSARKASAEQEVVVLQKAMDILAGKFSLLQVTKKGDQYDKRSRASGILRKLGHKLDNFGLLQAAQSVSDDPFVKVREMINDMIMRLEKQAMEEATKAARCKKDIETGTRDVKVKSEQMAKYQARLEKSNAKYGQLGSDISTLQEEVKQIGIDMKAWTTIRAEEKGDHAATVKDAEESIEALNGAIQTLSEFYGAALIQTAQPKSDTGNTIIAYLETAQEDYQRIRQETESAEKSAVNDYERSMQDAQVSLAKKNALIDGKTQERSGLKVMISTIDDDLAASVKEYDAATSFLKNKQAECANKAMSYEERQQKREEEIKGLQEALEILSAE